MQKLFILFLIALAVGATWQVKSRLDESARTAQVEREHKEQAEADRIKKLEADLARERGRNQSTRGSQQDIVNDLKQKILAEKTYFDSLQQRYQTARNRGQAQDWAASLEGQLKSQREVTQEIESQLKGLKTASSEIGNQGKLAQTQQRLGLKEQRAELEAQIHAQDLQLKDTQARINELKKDRLNFDAKAAIRPLQDQLTAQKLTLQVLKDQRGQLAVQTNAAVGDIQSDTQDRQINLRESREQMEARLRQEKEVYADLQKQLNEAKQDRGSQKSALEKLQADFQASRDHLNALKSQLQEQEKRLKEMGG
jgi:chromosome segregation ATPase